MKMIKCPMCGAEFPSKVKGRSSQANRLYWLYMDFIADQLGYDSAEDIHSAFKDLFLTDRSGILPLVRSTTSLDTKEFADYISKIIRKCAEMGIILPAEKYLVE